MALIPPNNRIPQIVITEYSKLLKKENKKTLVLIRDESYSRGTTLFVVNLTGLRPLGAHPPDVLTS